MLVLFYIFINKSHIQLHAETKKVEGMGRYSELGDCAICPLRFGINNVLNHNLVTVTRRWLQNLKQYSLMAPLPPPLLCFSSSQLTLGRFSLYYCQGIVAVSDKKPLLFKLPSSALISVMPESNPTDAGT